MRYIWLWLVVAAICGCDEVGPELLTPPASNTVEENAVDTEFPTQLYVRVIYVEPRLPAGQASRYREKAADIDAVVREVQTFFADELERHGYPRRTFTVREWDDGRVRVERLTLKQEASFYETHDGRVQLGSELFDYEMFGEYGHGWAQTPAGYLVSEFRIVFIDVPGYRIETFGGDACGLGAASMDSLDGYVEIPLVGPTDCNAIADVLAHELMHAFGLLGHDYRSDDYMLSYGASPNKISRGAAGWLAHHPAFLGKLPVSVEFGGSMDLGDFVQKESTLRYHVKDGASGIYQFELRFTAWFPGIHPEQEPAGFVAGVLYYEDDNRSALGQHVLRYLDKDTDANVLRVVDNDTLQHQYVEGGVAYVLRFEAKLPVPGDGFMLELLQYDGMAHWIYMQYLESGEFHRAW